LLLDKADTAAPVVVAWGNPGATLQPYGNAITGRTLPTTSPEPPAAGTSGTPAPSGAVSGSPQPSPSTPTATSSTPKGR